MANPYVRPKQPHAYGAVIKEQSQAYGAATMPVEYRPATTEAGKFVCPSCGKSFGVRVALAGHMRSHDKERT
jgi:predicted RNA-binding Zn-ribbon protein involved in translation (DUF1610 family)